MDEDLSLPNFISKYKIPIIKIIILILIVNLFLILYSLNTPIQDDEIKISKLFSYTEKTSSDISLSFVKNGECSAGLSTTDYIFDSFTLVSRLNSYYETKKLIDDCYSIAKTVQNTEGTIVIPKGSAHSGLNNINIYHWINTYHTRITKKESSTGYYLIQIDSDLIYVTVETAKLSTEVTINICSVK